MRVFWSDQAIADLWEIRDYIAEEYEHMEMREVLEGNYLSSTRSGSKKSGSWQLFTPLAGFRWTAIPR